MMINLFIHRFLDCDNFPEDVNFKVKQKMSTSNVRKVTCSHCKHRIVEELAKKDWSTLTPVEATAVGHIAESVKVEC